MYRPECDHLARILSKLHNMNSDQVYGPFNMKEFTGVGASYECQLQVASPGGPLCRAMERSHQSDDESMYERVLIFPLSANEAGKLVHIKLVDILCCGNVMHEWPTERFVISSQRFTDGVLVATEEREVSGVEHAISSVYIRGVERIRIMCKFSGDEHAKYTIVIVELRLCQDAGVRVINAGGSGGGANSVSGGGSGSDNAGGSGGIGGVGGSVGGNGGRSGAGGRGGVAGSDGGGGAGGRFIEDDDNDEGPVAGGSRRSRKFPRPSNGASAGLFSTTQDRHSLAGPNSKYAIPDQEEMIQLLAAQSASEKQSYTSNVVLSCVVCKGENKKKECVVCLLEETCMIFRPCNHIVCCKQCGNLEHIINCPVCRTPIQERMQVYGGRFN